jgi:FAD/FMN-containing dehydrogenase
VTPSGRLTRVDAHHEPDLFWAVRGGGGSVGVVTALEMRLYPVRHLYAGSLFFPLGRGAEVLHASRLWTDGVPDEVTSAGRIMRFPPLPEVPEPMRGRDFVVVEAAYAGSGDAGSALIRPLRDLDPEIDTFATMRAPALQLLHMDPEQPAPGVGDGTLLADAPAAAIDTVVALAGPRVDSSLVSVELRHLGGALARDAAGAGAQPRLDGKYAMFAAGLAPTRVEAEAVREDAATLKHALGPWRADHDYYNFAETPAGTDAVLPPAAATRLRAIKAGYDPDRTVVSVHPVT